MIYNVKIAKEQFREVLRYFDSQWKNMSIVSVSYCSGTVTINSSAKTIEDIKKLEDVKHIKQEFVK